MEYEDNLQLLRAIASWAGIIGSVTLSTVYFLFLGNHFLRRSRSSNSRLITIVENNLAASLGIPLSSVSAFCIVILLKAASTDPITIDVWGFKLAGASGPVALWVVCFLVNILAVKVLWKS
jgi:hypothetical protein